MTFQILSLSGGGYLGLYSVALLEELEAHCRRPIAQCFDLIAGTSIGGIIALGLAAEKPAKEIRQAFEQDGEAIFSARPAPTTALGQLRDFSRSFAGSKYSADALRATVERVVGKETRIGSLLHPVVIPAVNLTKGQPQVFKTDHHRDFRRDHRLRIADVAMATSAAPTYFPIAEIENELFVDGGLFANSPDLVGLHEAEHFFRIPTLDVRILSIGTTTTQFSFSHVGSRHLGVLQWKQRLAQTIISSQQMDVAYMLGHKLGDRYLRIDAVQSKEQEQHLGLDVATKDARATIKGVAAGSVQKYINNPMLQQMLAHACAAPVFHYRGE